jgi:hypothetical protein
MLYGQREMNSDFSYITTEWVVLLYFPVIPVRSMRIKGGTSSSVGFGTSMDYTVVARLGLYWRQIILTYAFAALCIGWGAFMLYLIDRLTQIREEGWIEISGVCCLMALSFLPLLLPRYLRKRDEERRGYF